MIHIEEFTSIEEVCSNVKKYADILLEQGVLVLRNANLSEEDQNIVQQAFGSHLGIWPRLGEGQLNLYREGHVKRAAEGFGGDDVMLPWHMEHPQYNNPICIGFWNMHTFDIEDNENGKTYFYNMEKYYEKLFDEDKEFLNKATSYKPDLGTFSAVGKHWYRNTPVIKALGDSELIIDEQLATEEQSLAYQQLVGRITDTVENDPENRIVLKWQKGDLAIVDVYIMAHAVTGGFAPGDRKFTGLWSYKDRDQSINADVDNADH